MALRRIAELKGLTAKKVIVESSAIVEAKSIAGERFLRFARGMIAIVAAIIILFRIAPAEGRVGSSVYSITAPFKLPTETDRLQIANSVGAIVLESCDFEQLGDRGVLVGVVGDVFTPEVIESCAPDNGKNFEDLDALTVIGTNKGVSTFPRSQLQTGRDSRAKTDGAEVEIGAAFISVSPRIFEDKLASMVEGDRAAGGGGGGGNHVRFANSHGKGGKNGRGRGGGRK